MGSRGGVSSRGGVGKVGCGWWVPRGGWQGCGVLCSEEDEDDVRVFDITLEPTEIVEVVHIEEDDAAGQQVGERGLDRAHCVLPVLPRV